MEDKEFSELFRIWESLLTRKEQCEFEMRYSKTPLQSWLSYHPKTQFILFLSWLLLIIVVVIKLLR